MRKESSCGTENERLPSVAQDGQYSHPAIRLRLYSVYRTLVRLGSPGYQRLTPVADHAPWTSDNTFTQTYRVIKSFTLVDPYRCYEIWSLVAQSAKLEGSLLEVGVWRGGSGALIATKATLCGITDTVYLCDTFTGVVKAMAQKDSSYRGGEHANTSKHMVEDLVYQRLHLTNVSILPGVFPETPAR
jgi:O-methyltransferase